jgi:hypothetical protein
MIMRVFIAILTIIVVSVPPSLAAARSRARAADTYFACEGGFTFEVSGSAARCRRAATVIAVPLAECPLANGAALTERVDHAGAKDMCVGTSGAAAVALERNCPNEYTKRVVTGLDRCERPTPEAIRPPSIPVVR